MQQYLTIKWDCGKKDEGPFPLKVVSRREFLVKSMRGMVIFCTGTSGLGLVSGCADRSTITVWAVSDDLSGDIAAAHLHLAEQGENGGVWIDVSNAVTDGNINFTSDDFDANELISLLSGDVYLNVHTPDFNYMEIKHKELEAKMALHEELVSNNYILQKR